MPSPLIDIPEDDIFKNDRLGLEPAIAARTQALLSRSPQAIAIDGHWGTGKSTFMALWAAYLRCQDIKVVQFNAWKSFDVDPFGALTKEILRQVRVPPSEQKDSHKRLLAFLKRYDPIAGQGLKLASSLNPELEGVPQAIELALQSAQHTIGLESNDTENSSFDSPEEFASVLSDAAKSWADRPIVVMIDELDRCNPEYAVDMLQLLEHVFHAEHVVFVVAVNRSELIHSIKAFYGQEFNAEGYLERFFDDVQALPTSNRRQYIENSLGSTIPRDMYSALDFLEASRLSLREIDKSVLHFKSVTKSHPELPLYALTHLWILRSLAPVKYRQFIAGEASDKALADTIFAIGTCNNLRTSRDTSQYRHAQELEITLIGASYALPRGSASPNYGSPFAKSELHRMHKEISEMEIPDAVVSADYSRLIVSRAEIIFDQLPFSRDVSAIHLAALLLERDLPPQ